MKVYRFMRENELKMYFNGQCRNIGGKFSQYTSKKFNNFKYKKGVKYIHFFAKLKDIYRIKHEMAEQEINSDERFFIGCFDIPQKLLSKSKGIGRYVITNSEDGTISECYVEEYALESWKMKEKYLVYFKQEKLDDKLHWQVDEMDKEM